jgi:putative tributyrin esterase
MPLQAHCYYAASIERRNTVYVYLPDAVADNKQRVPACYLLHGAHGSELDWWQQGRAPETLERLIREEGVPPMILIMPSDGRYYHGTCYVNWFDGTGRFEDAITQDLVSFVDANFPTLADEARYATGFSMGGYGAAHLALRHPGLFASVTSLSGYFSPETMYAYFPDYGERIYGPRDGKYARGYDLVFQAGRIQALPFRLLVECGTEDELIAANRHFHGALDARQIAHTYQEREGGHDWNYVSRHLADSFRFHTRTVQG